MNIREQINWFKNNKNYVYLDSAATALKPNCVVEAIKEYVDFYCTNPHNSDSIFAYKSKQTINETRSLLANFLNVKPDNIIFTPGATYSLNTISNAIEPFIFEDDEILITNSEHSSNILPWYKIRENKNAKIIFVDASKYLDKKINEDILNKITNKTKVVSFANGSNLFGNELDALLMAKKIKEINRNIIICVDSTQFLPHNKIDLKDSNIDFLVASAHKMMGPTGIGLLYIADSLIDKIKPNILGGGMNNELKRSYYTLSSGYAKFEGGTPNVMGIYGWNAALKFYEKLDLKSENKKVYELKKYLDDNLSKIDNIKIFNKDIKSFITLFNYENVFSQDLASFLGLKKIIVRSGLSCAKLSNEIINQEHAVRISLHYYNNKKDIDTLLKVIKEFKKGDEINELL